MANWSDLKAAVASIVKTNGNKEITGQLLQNVLNSIISNVGGNATYAGIATPSTNPGNPDGNVFYLAAEKGVYSNFNGFEIKPFSDVLLAILTNYNNTWYSQVISKSNIGIKLDKINPLDTSIEYIDSPTTTTDDLKNKVTSSDGAIKNGNYDLIRIEVPNDGFTYAGIALKLRENRPEGLMWNGGFSVVMSFRDENNAQLAYSGGNKNNNGETEFFSYDFYYSQFPKGTKYVLLYLLENRNNLKYYYPFSYCFVKKPYIMDKETGIHPYMYDYEIENAEKKIADIEKNTIKTKDYKAIGVDGKEKEHNYLGCTDFINTKNYKHVLLNTYYCYYREPLCFFYNSKKELIKFCSYFNSKEKATLPLKIRIPNEAQYVRINYVLESYWKSIYGDEKPYPEIKCEFISSDENWAYNESVYDKSSVSGTSINVNYTNYSEGTIYDMAEDYVISDLIPCSKGDLFAVGDGKQSVVGYHAVYDSELNILLFNRSTFSNYREVTFDNAAFIQFWYAPNIKAMIKKVESIEDKLAIQTYNNLKREALSEEVLNELESKTHPQFNKVSTQYSFEDYDSEGFRTLDYERAQKGLSIDKGGVLTANDSFAVSEYISIPNGVEIINILGDTNIIQSPSYIVRYPSSYIGFYDENKKPLALCNKAFNKEGNFVWLNQGEIISYSVPQNAKYFIVYAGHLSGGEYDQLFALGYSFTVIKRNNVKSPNEVKQYRKPFNNNVYNGIVINGVIDLNSNRYKISFVNIPKDAKTLTYSIIKPENWDVKVKKDANYSSLAYFYDASGNFIEYNTLDGYFTKNTVSYNIPKGAMYFVYYVGIIEDDVKYYPIQFAFNQFTEFELVNENGAIIDIPNIVRKYVKNEVQNVLPNELNYKPYTSELIRFKVEVNCSPLLQGDNVLSAEDGNNIGYDWGILRLPSNYTPNGKPVPLIISCHGATGHITETEGAIDINGYKGQLVRMGFAVMDMNGLPELYAPRVYDELHYGCPITIQCYIKGYEWVIKNYNIKRDGCFVEGASMGGMASVQIAACKQIPVLAYAGFCPAIDTFKQPYCNPWDTPNRARKEIALLFNFDNIDSVTFTSSKIPSTAEVQLFKDNIDKVLGYYPIFRHLVSGDVKSIFDVIPSTSDSLNESEQAIYDKFTCNFPVPVKIWHNWDDTTVRLRYSKYLCEMIKRAGGISYLREFPSGGHNAWDNGSKTNVLVDIDGNEMLCSSSVFEKYLWYKRWLID